MIKYSHCFTGNWNMIFYGLAVKTGSIALQNFFFCWFLWKKVCFLGSNLFFQIRLKKLMGHASHIFLIFSQVLE